MRATQGFECQRPGTRPRGLHSKHSTAVRAGLARQRCGTSSCIELATRREEQCRPRCGAQSPRTTPVQSLHPGPLGPSNLLSPRAVPRVPAPNPVPAPASPSLVQAPRHPRLEQAAGASPGPGLLPAAFPPSRFELCPPRPSPGPSPGSGSGPRPAATPVPASGPAGRAGLGRSMPGGAARAGTGGQRRRGRAGPHHYLHSARPGPAAPPSPAAILERERARRWAPSRAPSVAAERKSEHRAHRTRRWRALPSLRCTRLPGAL